MKTDIVSTHRHLLLLFDGSFCNPQGDVDRENRSRTDPETGRGFITSMGLKRKWRDRIEASGMAIYVSRGACFQRTDMALRKDVGIGDVVEDDKGADKGKGKKAEPKPKLRYAASEATTFYKTLCERFYDVRAFGQLVTHLPRSPRGPVQCSYAYSVEPVQVLRVGITRVAVSTIEEEEGQKKDGDGANRMRGATHVIPYGLYRAHIFVNPNDARKTGFSEGDYELLLKAIQGMFEFDTSSARPGMTVRALYAFEHNAHKDGDTWGGVGSVQGEQLLESIRVVRSAHSDRTREARSFEDYEVKIPTQHKTASEYTLRTIVDPKSRWTYETADETKAAE